MKGVWGEPGFPQGGLGALPPKRAPARPGGVERSPTGGFKGAKPP